MVGWSIIVESANYFSIGKGGDLFGWFVEAGVDAEIGFEVFGQVVEVTGFIDIQVLIDAVVVFN